MHNNDIVNPISIPEIIGTVLFFAILIIGIALGCAM